MAKQKSTPQSNASYNNGDSKIFLKGMNKDATPNFITEEVWTHARNAMNNSVNGDMGAIGNEPANLECAKIPYTVIGTIHKYGDEWIIFSTDDVSSEIGLFDDSKCEYTTIINDPCLNFKRLHLITGASKENFDCSWQVYWDDGFNPSRTLNLDDIPYVKVEQTPPGADCPVYIELNKLDCEKIRLAPLMSTPCLYLKKGRGGGSLRNGSYQAFIAYTINGARVTDYIGISNIQSLFDHRDTAGSLDLELTDLEEDVFTEFELVILSQFSQGPEARKIGVYSTKTRSISIDVINASITTTVPIEILPIRKPSYEKSDAMFVVNDWLIRRGPTEKFDFNYQPLANNIRVKWVVAEYPAEYYFKGGNKTSFMRDEQYAFFIRWIYNTGERSSSYHIPGRPAKTQGINQFGQTVNELGLNFGINAIESGEPNYKVFNTATVLQQGLSISTEDGGTIIAKGELAYWQSTERYPKDDVVRWGNLCGKPIRHHKMPTEETHDSLKLYNPINDTIRLLGVEFENIQPPLDNDGNVLTDIVGYEILRGSRLGNKSILAKGIIRNMRVYDIPDGSQDNVSNKGLYPNYPYNDLSPDIYFQKGNANSDSVEENRTDGCQTFSESIRDYPPLNEYKKDYFTFHSPELMFERPFLNAYILRLYGEIYGQSTGKFIPSENHPKQKLLRNIGAYLAAIVGVGYAINQMQGTYKGIKIPAKFTPRSKTANVNVGVTGVGGDAMFLGLDVPGWLVATVATAISGVSQAASGLGGLPAIAGLVSNISRRITQVDGAVAGTADENYPNLAGAYLGVVTSRSLLKLKGFVERAMPALMFGAGAESGGFQEEITKDTPLSNLPGPIALLAGLSLAQMNVSIGAQEIIDLLYNLVSEEDFAFKYNSHGHFDNYLKKSSDNVVRTRVTNSTYLGSSYQQFNEFKVNNLFRPGTTLISTEKQIEDPITEDTSRFTIGGEVTKSGRIISYGDKYIRDPQTTRRATISSHYGALKFDVDNQYGQISGISQIPMRGCVEKVSISNKQQRFRSAPIFSGDVYINRYTEKVIMPIFSDFLNGQPDLYPYDYLQRINIPYPRYWMDTRKFDTTQMGREILDFGFLDASDDNAPSVPNDMFYLDRGSSSCISQIFNMVIGEGDPNPFFAMRHAYMYTHVNGILDFFVESEKNLAQRDWIEEDRLRHYDPYYGYQDVDSLFHSNIIKEGNFYKYDNSLSISKVVTQIVTQANIQNPEYDPEVAESCLQYYPKRLIYSLRPDEENTQDYWKIFLPNNYKDFKNVVTSIKPFSKSGALIFFPYQSPQQFEGVDQLETDLGTKFTIGDGGLFSQPFKNITNSDLSNEYGSVESIRGIINTPYGLFFMSQAQGKIFNFQNSLVPISDAGMKFWFNKYLPSFLIKQFPELEKSKLSDNPVVGIGCQVIYDITNEIVYFCKKDYRVRDRYINNMRFENDAFYYSISKGATGTKVQLGDPLYFEDTSWVVSYDPKLKAWISFHDWTPELTMSSIRTFLSTKTLQSSTPICPPGYNFNSTTGKCEGIKQVSQLASVIVDTVPVTIVDETCNCPPGYSIVYRDENNHFTSPFGNCTITVNPPIGAGEVCYTIRGCDGEIYYVPKTGVTRTVGEKVFWQELNSNYRECGEIIDDSFSTTQYTGVLYEDNITPSINLFGNDYCSTLLIDPITQEPENICGSLGIRMDQPVQPNQNPVEPTIEVNAICRKIECLCPISPFQGGTTTETGNCDDVFSVGDPNYVNNLPKMCHYFFADEVLPNYNQGSIWRHNDRCDLFVNYYGVDYPWEIEIPHSTQMLVNTLRSVEYQLECFVYRNLPNGECSEDRWHDLDFNFDEAIIHNSEQISGLLKLNLNPKEDPYQTLQFPRFNLNDIDILYSKEEQKYRFNQFFDITKDRGEFTGTIDFKFNTRFNGYIRDLNLNNLDYQKEPFQLKKFRHYYNMLILRRTVSGNRKMLMKISNVKLNVSPR